VKKNNQKTDKEIKRISFSELKNWKECPYRHKLIYVDKLKSFQGNEYTAFGTAIHRVCEEIIYNNNKKAPIDIFNSFFLEELNSLKSLGLSLDKKMVEEMRIQAGPICEQVLPSVYDHFGNFDIISVEEEILEPITEFESFGTNFKGFIDLVIRTPDQKYHIIDWKTCSWGWNQNKKTDPMTTYQLTYYKNYFSKKHQIPLEDIETSFVLLKRTAKKENVEVLKISSGPKKVDNSLKVLQNAVINIENKNYIKNRLNCKYCEFYKTENCT
jgi:hypothetical protein